VTTGVSYKPFSGGARVDLTFGDQYFMPGQSSTVGVGDIHGIWVDQNNLYVSDLLNGAVLSTGRASDFITLVADYAGPNSNSPCPACATDAGGPLITSPFQFIAVTADDENVYWVDNNQGQVMQERIDGLSPPVILANAGSFHPVAIAVANGFVYWINSGSSTPSTGSVNKVARDPVGAGTVIPLATGQDQPQGITTDGVNVYWTSSSNSGSVRKVSVNGGSIAVIADNQGGPLGIVVDQPTPDAGVSTSYVYWTNFNDNSVQKLPASTTGPSTPLVLASGQTNPIAIAVDSKAVYWANQGDGSMRKVAK
jgi:hypothetical protein